MDKCVTRLIDTNLFLVEWPESSGELRFVDYAHYHLREFLGIMADGNGFADDLGLHRREAERADALDVRRHRTSLRTLLTGSIQPRISMTKVYVFHGHKMIRMQIKRK